MRFSGRHPKYPIMQVLELGADAHPYFIAAQFHPELTSRPLDPHPMFMGLVANAIKYANPGVRREEAALLSRWLRTPATPNDAKAPEVPIVRTKRVGGVHQA